MFFQNFGRFHEFYILEKNLKPTVLRGPSAFAQRIRQMQCRVNRKESAARVEPQARLWYRRSGFLFRIAR